MFQRAVSSVCRRRRVFLEFSRLPRNYEPTTELLLLCSKSSSFGDKFGDNFLLASIAGLCVSQPIINEGHIAYHTERHHRGCPYLGPSYMLVVRRACILCDASFVKLSERTKQRVCPLGDQALYNSLVPGQFPDDVFVERKRFGTLSPLKLNFGSSFGGRTACVLKGLNVVISALNAHSCKRIPHNKQDFQPRGEKSHPFFRSSSMHPTCPPLAAL